MSDFRNPMKFYCAPNGCGPDIANEHDFERFVAYGLLMSYEYLKGKGTELMKATDADVVDLRTHFLITLQNAIDSLPDMISRAAGKDYIGQKTKRDVSYDGDMAENYPLIEAEGTDNFFVRWEFLSLLYHGEPSVIFDIAWGSHDDGIEDRNSAFLALGAIYGPAANVAEMDDISFVNEDNEHAANVRKVMKAAEEFTRLQEIVQPDVVIDR